jgi:hypothetical protein
MVNDSLPSHCFSGPNSLQPAAPNLTRSMMFQAREFLPPAITNAESKALHWFSIGPLLYRGRTLPVPFDTDPAHSRP